MRALAVVLSALSAVLLGAHVMRSGHLALALAVAAFPVILLVRSRWAIRATQALLAAGAAEWLRTLSVLRAERLAHGLPWMRLTLILGAVALLAAVAARLLQRTLPRDAPG